MSLEALKENWELVRKILDPDGRKKKEKRTIIRALQTKFPMAYANFLAASRQRFPEMESRVEIMSVLIEPFMIELLSAYRVIPDDLVGQIGDYLVLFDMLSLPESTINYVIIRSFFQIGIAHLKEPKRTYRKKEVIQLDIDDLMKQFEQKPKAAKPKKAKSKPKKKKTKVIQEPIPKDNPPPAPIPEENAPKRKKKKSKTKKRALAVTDILEKEEPPASKKEEPQAPKKKKSIIGKIAGAFKREKPVCTELSIPPTIPQPINLAPPGKARPRNRLFRYIINRQFTLRDFNFHEICRERWMRGIVNSTNWERAARMAEIANYLAHLLHMCTRERDLMVNSWNRAAAISPAALNDGAIALRAYDEEVRERAQKYMKHYGV